MLFIGNGMDRNLAKFLLPATIGFPTRVNYCGGHFQFLALYCNLHKNVKTDSWRDWNANIQNRVRKASITSLSPKDLWGLVSDVHCTQNQKWVKIDITY
jgi:hypothetical protein